MKKLLLLLAILVSIKGYASISMTAESAPTHIGTFEKWEMEYKVNVGFTNPYDPDEIDMYCIFTSPDGSTSKVNAFYYVSYVRNLTPDPVTAFNPSLCVPDPFYPDPDYLRESRSRTLPWRIRFAPNKPGHWSYKVYASLAGGTSTLLYSNSFSADYLPNKGYICIEHHPENSRSFLFKDGTIFYPRGVSGVIPGYCDHYNRSHYIFSRNLINNLAANGCNFTRLWADAFGFGLEWKNQPDAGNGVNNYSTRQNRAYDFDDLLEQAHKNGVYIQYCLEDVEHFNISDKDPTHDWDWISNPYRGFHGAINPLDFFTNDFCKAAFKKRIRYTIARWGYSPNIFGFEMFNEADDVTAFSTPGILKNAEIVNWHDEMIHYAKSLDNHNHIFTTSVATIERNEDMLGLRFIGIFYGAPVYVSISLGSTVDYIQDHHYSSAYNVDHQISYMTYREKHLTHGKPFLIGEFGTGLNDCPTPIDYSPISPLYSLNHFHNGIWASVLSGGSAALLDFDAGSIFCMGNGGTGGQAAYFKPLNMFLDGEDLHMNNYTAISNKCSGISLGTAEDDQPGHTDNCFVSGSPEVPLFENSDISISDPHIEAFALKSPSKILGWVHNQDNYWNNLHHLGVDHCLRHNFADDTVRYSIDPGPHYIPEYVGAQITINGLQCDGKYRVDFYSAYPQMKIQSAVGTDDGVREGGIIPSISGYIVYSHCGSIDFPLPDLGPITHPLTTYEAPDYGFKVTKIEDSWSHDILTGHEVGSGGIAMDNLATQIGFRDFDGRLHIKYRGVGSSTWGEFVATDAAGADHRVADGGDIVRGSGSNMFAYKGHNGKLQAYYWDATSSTWLHTDFMASPGVNIDGSVGSVAITPDGTQISYRGNDNKVHYYYWAGTGWSQDTHDGGPGTHIIGALAVTATGLIPYHGEGNKLQAYYWDASSSTWLHTWISGPGSEDVGGSIVVPSGAPSTIIYIGHDNQLHKYHWDGTWIHNYIDQEDGSHIGATGQLATNDDGTQIFFRDPSSKQIVVAYKVLGDHYVKDNLMCDLAMQLEFRNDVHKGVVATNGTIAYGGDNKLQVYLYNQGCTDNTFYHESHRDADRDSVSTNVSSPLDIPNTVSGLNTVYPNPFSNELNIKVVSSNCHLRITNLYGQLMYEKAVEKGNNEQIITSSYPPGMYILQMINDDDADQKSEYYKLIKN